MSAGGPTPDRRPEPVAPTGAPPESGGSPGGRQAHLGPESEIPPSYPPRRDLQGARHLERDGLPTAKPAGRRVAPRWTSVSTGLRFGPLTTPGIALLLLVLGALLGALVASRIHGAGSPSKPRSPSSQIQTYVRESPEPSHRDGMIIPIVASHEFRATELSTTKDT